MGTCSIVVIFRVWLIRTRIGSYTKRNSEEDEHTRESEGSA